MALEGVHCNSVVSINERDVHAANGVIAVAATHVTDHRERANMASGAPSHIQSHVCMQPMCQDAQVQARSTAKVPHGALCQLLCTRPWQEETCAIRRLHRVRVIAERQIGQAEYPSY